MNYINLQSWFTHCWWYHKHANSQHYVLFWGHNWYQSFYFVVHFVTEGCHLFLPPAYFHFDWGDERQLQKFQNQGRSAATYWGNNVSCSLAGQCLEVAPNLPWHPSTLVRLKSCVSRHFCLNIVSTVCEHLPPSYY